MKRSIRDLYELEVVEAAHGIALVGDGLDRWEVPEAMLADEIELPEDATEDDERRAVEGWCGRARERLETMKAAAALGRKGRAVNSPAQQAASRESGAKGGRPPRDPEFATWKTAFDAKHPVGQSSHTGLWGWSRCNDGLDISMCIHKTEKAAKQARAKGLYEFYLGEKKRIENARKGIY